MASLCPHFPFVKGYQSFWIRAHCNDLLWNWLSISVKTPFSKQACILRSWGFGIQHIFWRDAVQPITYTYDTGLLGWLDETIHKMGLTQCLAHSKPSVSWLLSLCKFIMPSFNQKLTFLACKSWSFSVSFAFFFSPLIFHQDKCKWKRQSIDQSKHGKFCYLTIRILYILIFPQLELILVKKKKKDFCVYKYTEIYYFSPVCVNDLRSCLK